MRKTRLLRLGTEKINGSNCPAPTIDQTNFHRLRRIGVAGQMRLAHASDPTRGPGPGIQTQHAHRATERQAA